MAASTDERIRILRLVESGNVTAEEAARLLDSLQVKQEHTDERKRNRIVRVRVTNLSNNRQKANVTVPVSLIDVGLRLATRLVPQIRGSALEDLLHAIENGTTGRLLDLQDLEEGERIEIYTE
jgi:acyl CoA:acetate/3-ketoacid CoA transferase